MGDARQLDAPTREPGISHWSRPGAIRTLQALRQLGGQATTRQIAQITQSVAVHSDITSVRYFCEAAGVCSAHEAVECSYSGRSETGRSVYFYTLHPRVMQAIRTGLLEGRPTQAALF